MSSSSTGLHSQAFAEDTTHYVVPKDSEGRYTVGGRLFNPTAHMEDTKQEVYGTYDDLDLQSLNVTVCCGTRWLGPPTVGPGGIEGGGGMVGSLVPCVCVGHFRRVATPNVPSGPFLCCCCCCYCSSQCSELGWPKGGGRGRDFTLLRKKKGGLWGWRACVCIWQEVKYGKGGEGKGAFATKDGHILYI